MFTQIALAALECEVGRVEIGVSESILASLGPRVLARVPQTLPELELIGQRSPQPGRH